MKKNLGFVFMLLCGAFFVGNKTFALTSSDYNRASAIAHKLSEIVDGNIELQKRLVVVLDTFEPIKELAPAITTYMEWDIGENCADSKPSLDMTQKEYDLLEQVGCNDGNDFYTCMADKGYPLQEGTFSIGDVYYSADKWTSSLRYYRWLTFTKDSSDTQNYMFNNTACSIIDGVLSLCDASVYQKNLPLDNITDNMLGIKKVVGYDLGDLKDDLSKKYTISSSCESYLFEHLGNISIIYDALGNLEITTLSEKKEVVAELELAVDKMKNGKREDIDFDNFVYVDNAAIWWVDYVVYPDGILGVLAGGQGEMDISLHYLTIEEDAIVMKDSGPLLSVTCDACDGSDDTIMEILSEDPETYERIYGKTTPVDQELFEYIKKAFRGEATIGGFSEAMKRFKQQMGI